MKKTPRFPLPAEQVKPGARRGSGLAVGAMEGGRTNGHVNEKEDPRDGQDARNDKALLGLQHFPHLELVHQIIFPCDVGNLFGDSVPREKTGG